MKKALTLILLLALSVACVSKMQAQGRKVIYLQQYEKTKYHWGFLLGVNFMDYSLDLKDDFQNQKYYKDQDLLPDLNASGGGGYYYYYQIAGVETKKMTRNPGFSVGFIGDIRLGRYFNFRFIPTLSFSWRYIEYNVAKYDANDNFIPYGANSNTQTPDNGSYIYESKDNFATYFEFPLHLKYRSKRYNNIGAYLIAGVNPKFYLISANKSFSETTGKPNYLIPQRADLALEFGTGFDIYNQWFKLGMEIKMSLGMLNLYKEVKGMENFLFLAPLESLKSKQLQVSFTFE